MKQLSTTVQISLITVLVILLLSDRLPAVLAQTPDPGATSQSACDSSRSLHVTGSAQINVVPDRALVQLGVQSNGATTAAVQAANMAAIKNVLHAMQSQGVAAKDIATDIYVIEPIYENYDSLYIKGYRIHNLVAVTVREVRKTSEILAAALEAGANQVVNVEFYTSELRKHRDQARELAMTAAREKAQALATAAGAETGCVLSISENSWSYYNGWWYGRSQNMWAQNVVQNATPAASLGENTSDDPISLGQISIKAEVGATYSLK